MERDSGAPCSMTVTITNEEQPESMGKVAQVCKYLFSPCSITAYPFCKIVIKGLCSSKSFKLFLFFFLYLCLHAQLVDWILLFLNFKAIILFLFIQSFITICHLLNLTMIIK